MKISFSNLCDGVISGGAYLVIAPEIKNIMLNLFIALIVTVINSILIPLIRYVFKKLKAKIDANKKLDDETKNELNSAADTASKQITTAAAEVAEKVKEAESGSNENTGK